MIEDEIVSIEEIPLHDTMDIEVDGDHLFMANDILTHNSGYEKNENPSLVSMSESMKKIEHADFVATLKSIEPEQDNQTDIRMDVPIKDFRIIIGKNRSGPKNKIVNLKSNFSHFRINDNSRTVAVPFLNNEVIADSIL